MIPAEWVEYSLFFSTQELEAILEQSNQSNSDMESDAEAKLQAQKGLRDQESEMSKRGKLSFVIVISGQTHEMDCVYSYRPG